MFLSDERSLSWTETDGGRTMEAKKSAAILEEFHVKASCLRIIRRKFFIILSTPSDPLPVHHDVSDRTRTRSSTQPPRDKTLSTRPDRQMPIAAAAASQPAAIYGPMQN